MCSYIGTDDPSRDHQVDLHFQDLLDVVPSYSKVKLVAEDEGLLPFTVSNQAPVVSRLSSRALVFIPLIMFADEFLFLQIAEVQGVRRVASASGRRPSRGRQC